MTLSLFLFLLLQALPLPRMVEIPAGTFWMGTDNPPMEDWDEAPRREVKVDAFRMSATEITNAQYEAFDPTHKRGEQRCHSLLSMALRADGEELPPPFRRGMGVRLPGRHDHCLLHRRRVPGKPVEGPEEYPRQGARFPASDSVRAQCVGLVRHARECGGVVR